MPDAISRTNLINSAGQITLGTNVDQVDTSDDLLRNLFDTSGMVTTRLKNDTVPGSISFVVDLGTSATRDVIGFASNVKAGTATIITQTGGGGTVQTFSSLSPPGLPVTAQTPFTMNYIRPTTAFQKISFAWTAGTGDIDPVEIFFIYCANDIIETPNPSLPSVRTTVGVNQIVNGISHSRGLALTMRFFGDIVYPDITLANMAVFFDTWNDTDFGCEKILIFENWAATSGASDDAGTVWDIVEVPRYGVVHQQSNVFDFSYGVQGTTNPTYPIPNDLAFF